MTWHTSSRERRLWCWTFAVLGSIYAAAALAGSLVNAIGSELLLGIAFAGGFTLAIAAILGMALARGSHTEGWVALGVAASYVMLPVRLGIPALERTHLFEYGLLATLLYEALNERAKSGTRFPTPGLLAVVSASLLGWLDEGLQWLLPNRVYDVRDVGVNCLAAVIAVGAVAATRWLRSRHSVPPTPPDRATESPPHPK